MSEATEDIHGFYIDVDDLFPCGFQVRHRSGTLVPQQLVDHLRDVGHFGPRDDSATCLRVKSKLTVEIMDAFQTGQLYFEPVRGWGFEDPQERID